jgi:hypothetical protein
MACLLIHTRSSLNATEKNLKYLYKQEGRINKFHRFAGLADTALSLSELETPNLLEPANSLAGKCEVIIDYLNWNTKCFDFELPRVLFPRKLGIST